MFSNIFFKCLKILVTCLYSEIANEISNKIIADTIQNRLDTAKRLRLDDILSMLLK